MPYIHPERRAVLEPMVLPLIAVVEEWGDLNFLFTRLVQEVLHGARYEDYQAAIGLFECAKLELYRRLVASYEDLKIEENGDLS